MSGKTTMPHEGLTHLPIYDVKDSNVELIGSKVDHLVKFKSAQTEPAWSQDPVGKSGGIFVWRIENFEVTKWPKEKQGNFHEGDSYIILHSYKVGEEDKLRHDIFFWLGASTSRDEAGTAAYKTVELDEYLGGIGTQFREVQDSPSPAFQSLFPRITILSGGVASGFTHVGPKETEKCFDLYRVTKATNTFSADTPSAKTSTLVKQVAPKWTSLVEDDCFILDTGEKLTIWQGKQASPIEKAKAAQVVHDMGLSRQTSTEVIAQTDSRSYVFLQSLGATSDSKIASQIKASSDSSKRAKKLFRLSDASGRLTFDLIKDASAGILKGDLQSQDIFVFDSGLHIWVWQGSQASVKEKAMWLKVAQAYLDSLQGKIDSPHLSPIAKVVEGYESPAFLSALSR